MERLERLSSTLIKAPIAGETKELFSHVTMAPPDPILGTAIAYKADTDANKINLGIGAYRDDSGVPYVFPVVRKVEQELTNAKLDKVEPLF
jgi:aspartate/tyrosine/aromatic aminotransferase